LSTSGVPPVGYCWAVAIYPLQQRYPIGLPGASQIPLAEICFKPQIKTAPLLPDVDLSAPCFVLETPLNPLGLRYRCIDGKHRIHRQLAAGATTIACRVLELDDVIPHVVAVPLCLLPPLPAGLDALPEEDDVTGSSAEVWDVLHDPCLVVSLVLRVPLRG
jgi:hypothetical protein